MNIPCPTIFNFLALTNSLVKRNRSRVRKIQDSPPKNGISRLFFLVERWDDMWLLERLKLFSILRVWLLSRHFTALNFFSFERWYDAIFPLKRLKQLYHCSLLYFESSEIGKVPLFLHVPKRPTIIFLLLWGFNYLEKRCNATLGCFVSFISLLPCNFYCEQLW